MSAFLCSSITSVAPSEEDILAHEVGDGEKCEVADGGLEARRAGDAEHGAVISEAEQLAGDEHLRPRGHQARTAAAADRRRPQADGGRRQHPRRHQHLYRGRPVDGEVAVPEVHQQHFSALGVHFGKVVLGGRSHGGRGSRRGDGRDVSGGGRADAVGQRYLLHRRVRQDGLRGPSGYS